jgi:hypothetical protein
MYRYAKMQNDLVINIEIANEEWINSQEDPSIFIKYDDENPAVIGGLRYNGFFYQPQPFNSWLRDEENHTWTPPIPYPSDEKIYFWNEDILNWEED